MGVAHTCANMTHCSRWCFIDLAKRIYIVGSTTVFCIILYSYDLFTAVVFQDCQLQTGGFTLKRDSFAGVKNGTVKYSVPLTS